MGYRPKYACSCPFYEKEIMRGICCEGIGTSSQTTLTFETEEKKIEYIKNNCIMDCPENCELFQILTMKYAAVD